MVNHMEQSLIFGIPFLHYKTKNWKKYRRFLQESFKNSSKFTDFWDDRSGDLLPDYCDKVVDVIAPNLQKFAEVINPNPVMITEMWYEKSKKGDKHSIHNHGGQGYSAEGDLIIFPSELLHEALPNKSDEERIVVSFNIASWQQMRSYNVGKKEVEDKFRLTGSLNNNSAARVGF